MISIWINGEARKWPSEGDEKWITQRINGLRRDGQAVCVRVTIELGSGELTFQTPTCASSFGGSRPLNRDEARVLELCQQLHLNSADFSAGNVVAFVKQAG